MSAVVNSPQVDDGHIRCWLNKALSTKDVIDVQEPDIGAAAENLSRGKYVLKLTCAPNT